MVAPKEIDVKPKTMAFSIRLSKEDRASINQAAKFLGCSYSSFIRDAAVTQAEKIVSDPEAFAISRVRRLIREHRSELDKMLERSKKSGIYCSGYEPDLYSDEASCQCSDCTVEREDER